MILKTLAIFFGSLLFICIVWGGFWIIFKYYIGPEKPDPRRYQIVKRSDVKTGDIMYIIQHLEYVGMYGCDSEWVDLEGYYDTEEEAVQKRYEILGITHKDEVVK